MQVHILPPELSGQPDVVAMLQAFYSRSHQSIGERLKELTNNDLAKTRESLKRYYIGYGHDSIADCGHLTLFIENVSMLTAKAIQDHPLYNGQETSSRYIDFDRPNTEDYLDSTFDYWLDLYRSAKTRLPEILAFRHPDLSEQAIKVRSFDIARGLLPTGVLTQLSWHSSIRVVRQHLADLLVHPIQIVRVDAQNIQDSLAQYMPEMFETLPEPSGHAWFLSKGQRNTGLSVSPLWNTIQDKSAHLPRYGTSVYRNQLDYGSYRDLQRHRRSYIRSTVPTQELGPHNWYLANLPREISDEILRNWDFSNDTPWTTPLMSLVSTMVVFDVPQLEYLTSLRTGPSVHQTLRHYMTDLAESVVELCPNLNSRIEPLINREQTDWARRANQTIKLKDQQ